MADISYFKGSDHLNAKKTQWRVAVGRFLLEFAEIEWFTYHIISELPTEKIFDATKDLPFHRRAVLAEQLLESKGLDQFVTQRAVGLLRRARKLSKTRNILAHNPLLLDLFSDAIGQDLSFNIHRYGDIEPALSLEQLEIRTDEVENINKELHEVIDRVRAEMGIE